MLSECILMFQTWTNSSFNNVCFPSGQSLCQEDVVQPPSSSGPPIRHRLAVWFRFSFSHLPESILLSDKWAESGWLYALSVWQVASRGHFWCTLTGCLHKLCHAGFEVGMVRRRQNTTGKEILLDPGQNLIVSTPLYLYPLWLIFSACMSMAPRECSSLCNTEEGDEGAVPYIRFELLYHSIKWRRDKSVSYKMQPSLLMEWYFVATLDLFVIKF